METCTQVEVLLGMVNNLRNHINFVQQTAGENTSFYLEGALDYLRGLERELRAAYEAAKDE